MEKGLNKKGNIEPVNWDILRTFGIHFLIFIKSFWQSAILIISGLVTLMFFVIGLSYLRTEGLLKEIPFEVNSTLFIMIDFLGNNWKYFMVSSFLLYYIVNLNETQRDL